MNIYIYIYIFATGRLKCDLSKQIVSVLTDIDILAKDHNVLPEMKVDTLTEIIKEPSLLKCPFCK